MEKFSYKSLFIIVAILLIGIVFLGRIQQKRQTVLADWYNDAWMYRQSINVSTHNVGETNVYIVATVNIGSTTKAQSDDGDFRFTDSTGNLLPYYISSGTGTTNVTVHINFTSLPAGPQTIYAYYGNPAAPNGFQNSSFSTQASNYTIGSYSAEEVGGGPVAWWKFDEGNGTIAYDSSGKNNNGSFSGGATFPTWATDDQCISNKCLYSSNNGNLTVNNSNTINFTTNSFTVTQWIKPQDYTYPKTTFSLKKGNAPYSPGSGHEGWSLSDSYSANGAQVVINDGTSMVSTILNFDIGSRPPDFLNKWTQLVFVFNRQSNLVTAYVNGTKQSNTISIASVTGSIANTSTLLVGMGTGWTYKGYFDDVKIYPYARTDSQIKQDYATSISGQSTAKGAAVNFGSNSSKTASDGLVGSWKFDEGVGTTTADSSGNSNTATFQGNAASNGGKFGIGTSFDGLDDSLVVTDSPSLSIGGTGLTLSAWIYPNTANTAGSIIHKGSHYSLYRHSTGAISYADSVSWSYSGNGYFGDTPANQWSHVAVTFDGTNRKHYINGVLVGTKNSPGSLTDNTTNVLIGCYDDSGVGGATCGDTYSFNGKIDEARVYNRTLSADDIKKLYNYTPGPVGYWKFDEGVGTSAFDSSGNSKNGGFWNPVSWTTGKIGNAISLGSTQMFVDTNLYQNYNQTNYTLNAWIYPTNSTTGSFLTNSYDSNYSGGNTLYVGSNTIISWSLNYAASAYLAVTVPAGLYNKWSYVTATANKIDPTNTLYTIYVNGISVGSTTASFSYTNPGLYPYRFGVCYTGFYQYCPYSGKIDDIKIYNYVRSQEQILQDMQGDSALTPRNSKPLIWYKLDEGQGSVADNWGVGGLTYRLNLATGDSSPTWNNGKSNKGLSFDGFNDSVAAANMYIPGANNFSLTGWFNINTGATTPYDIPIFGNNQYTSLLGYVPSSQTFRQLKQFTGGAGNYTVSWVTAYQYADSQWHHVAVSVDQGTTSAALYLDGKLYSTQSIGGTEGYTHSNGAFRGIGRNYGVSMNGSLDEMKVYNYALTADDVKTDYNQNSSFTFGSSSQTVGATTSSLEYCIPGDTSPCALPVAEWKFDEGVGTTAYDTSGNNNTGIINGGTWTIGKTGQSLSLNGTSDYINTGSTYDPSNYQFTTSAWVKTSDSTGIISCRSASTICTGVADHYGLQISSGYALFSFSAGDVDVTTTSTTQINDGKWHHITGTRSAVRTANIYVDGKLEATSSPAGSSTSIDIAGSHLIGQFNSTDYLTGQIDLVRVYNYARTPSQVAYDYNKGGPIGWWKMDDCQGTQIADWSGNANHGTLVVGASGTQNTAGTCQIGTSAAWTAGASGKVNGSLNFDGTDDYVNLNGSNTSLQITGDMTISSWIKTNYSASYQIVIDDLGGSPFTSWCQWLDTSGKVVWYDSGNWRASQTAVNNGQWHHVVSVVSNNNLKFYIDGVQDPSTYSNVSARVATSDNKRIGTRGDGTSYPFNGQIDDVRIYNYPLTTTQIQTLYNGGAVSFK